MDPRFRGDDDHNGARKLRSPKGAKRNAGQSRRKAPPPDSPRLRGGHPGYTPPPPPSPRLPNSTATTEVRASPPSTMFGSNTTIAWRRTMHVVTEPAILY